MFTVENFIELVKEDMCYTTCETNNREDGLISIIVKYEDYKTSTFHYYNITVKGEIIHLYIFAEGIDDPIDILMPEDLKHAYNVMKAHDDLMWTIKEAIDRGDLT